MWPEVARAFDLEVAHPLPMELEKVMADKAPMWQHMVQRYDLAPNSYSDVS